MGEECADQDIMVCMANAETEYLLPDGPPDSEESEPEQSEESEPEQSEESEPEPEQSEESEPQPDQSGETETETETESGELSDGAGTGQAVQTHGSSANALSSGMACLMVALLSICQL